MSANQMKRLKLMSRRKLTLPPTLKQKIYDGWNADATAEKLVDGLDWDGSAEYLHSKEAPTEDRRNARALEDENTLLKRQIEVLLMQVAAGGAGAKASLPPIPALPLSTLPAATSPGAAARGSATARVGNAGADALSGDAAHGHASDPLHPSGAATERAAHPRPPAARTTRLRAPLSVRSARGAAPGQDKELAALRAEKRDAERAHEQLSARYGSLRKQKQDMQERLWSLEECLDSKDAEMRLRAVEVDHLKYRLPLKVPARRAFLQRSLGVKAGEVRELRRELQSYRWAEGAEENSGEDVRFEGRGYCGEIDRAVCKMEDDLVEHQVHVTAEEERNEEAGRLLELLSLFGERQREEREAARLFRGENGEYMSRGCPQCGVQRMVNDQEVQTEEVMFVEEPEEEVEEVEEEKKKKKKLRRRVNRDLVPKPFDTVITTTERWEKERENRIKMATERKVLLAVTAVFTEKIIADATDDATGGEREPMKSYVHEC